jgi:protein-tyrosine phosphatase
MAEALLRQQAQAAGLGSLIQVRSAGVSAQPGQPPTPAALEALARRGIAHAGAARRLTLRDVQQADYVIVMDADNRAAVAALLADLPEPPPCHYLLAFAPEQGLQEVPDPFGTTTYDAVCGLIEAGVSGLLAYLVERA